MKSMKSMYAIDAYEEVVRRIDNLQGDAAAQWGKMNVSAMLAHCSEIFEVFNGTKELKGTPWFMRPLRGLIRRAVFSAKPFRRGVPTHPQYDVSGGTFDFDDERDRLLANIAAFVSEDPDVASRREHPLLGVSTPDERGTMMYKHLDHHLSQFGV